MKDSITLSPKHGLNPSILQCPICHKDMGIALCGKLKDDAEAPKYMDGGLCEDCRKKYITILEADEELTGRYCFVKREAVDSKFSDAEKLLMRTEDFQALTLIS